MTPVGHILDVTSHCFTYWAPQVEIKLWQSVTFCDRSDFLHRILACISCMEPLTVVILNLHLLVISSHVRVVYWMNRDKRLLVVSGQSCRYLQSLCTKGCIHLSIYFPLPCVIRAVVVKEFPLCWFSVVNWNSLHEYCTTTSWHFHADSNHCKCVPVLVARRCFKCISMRS